MIPLTARTKKATKTMAFIAFNNLMDSVGIKCPKLLQCCSLKGFMGHSREGGNPWFWDFS